MKTNNPQFNYRDPKSVGEVLHQNDGLYYLFNKAQRIIDINHLLSQILPSELAAHCQVMNMAENILAIQVTNASWASRLRYLEAELLKKLWACPLTSAVKKIEYRVRAKDNPDYSTPAETAPLTISPKTRQLLRELAAHIASPELKKSLLNLSGSEDS